MTQEKRRSRADMADRWMFAAAELNGLLDENDALLERRASLRRQRAELFREIVEEARTFVDGVCAPRER